MSLLFCVALFASGYACCYFDLVRFLRPANPVQDAIRAEQKKLHDDMVAKIVGRGIKK
jgi:hypothetical protein